MKSLSLRLRLTVFISALLFVACSITTVVAYFELHSSLRQLFDSQQLLFAKRLAALNLHGKMDIDKSLPHIKTDALDQLDFDDDALAFAIFNQKGEMLLNDGENGRKFLFDGGFFPSIKNGALITESGKWRILWLLSNDNRSIIAVGQELDYQEDILASLLYKQLIPWLLTFIIVILLIIFMINREFSPIKQLVKQITTRELDDQSPISTANSPKEIVPFVVALNKLFTRISMTIARERQFISDAAHELRTPLAALKVQTEVAQLSDDDAIAQQKALKNLNIGIDRATHLVDQLLTLSRLDSIQIQQECQQLDWHLLIQHVIDQVHLLAEQKQIKIVLVEQAQDHLFNGHPVLMQILVRNIINNAIRYTPEGSTLDICIDNHLIKFADNGNGVDDETLARLGERFYRPAGQSVDGSGLGLSIVKKIAKIHAMPVQFGNRHQGGFEVTICY